MGLPPLRPGFRQKVLCQRGGVRLVRGRGAPSTQASHLSPRLEVQDTLCGDVDTRSSFRVVSNPGPPPADVEATEAAKLDLLAPNQRGDHRVEDRLNGDSRFSLRHQ